MKAADSYRKFKVENMVVGDNSNLYRNFKLLKDMILQYKVSPITLTLGCLGYMYYYHHRPKGEDTGTGTPSLPYL